MDYEIYCDESHPDVFWSRSEKCAKYLLIGGIWLPATARPAIKEDIDKLKHLHGFRHELKWHRLSNASEALFRDLVDLFFDYKQNLRFRCIMVEGDKVDLVKFHDSDAELGFYKFYYQLIKHWIDDFSTYRIFCDAKTNRHKGRLETLRRTLDYSNLSSRVISVQALPSHELSLLQLVDFLIGLVSAKLNGKASHESAKFRLIDYFETRLGYLIQPTNRRASKFNVFKIDLERR